MNLLEEFKNHLLEILEVKGELKPEDIELCYGGCFENKVREFYVLEYTGTTFYKKEDCDVRLQKDLTKVLAEL